MIEILITKVESKECPNQAKFPENWGKPWTDIWYIHTITDDNGNEYLHKSKDAEMLKIKKEILVRKKSIKTENFGKVRSVIADFTD